MHFQRPMSVALCAAIAFSLWPAGQGRADTITAIDAGFVTEAGGSAKGDGTVVPPATYNYSVGRELHYAMGAFGPDLAPMDRKNYFVFDLSGISETIVSATLEVYAGVYESVDPTEMFALVAPGDPGAALGDAAFLLAANGIGMSEFDSPADPAIMVAMALHGNLSAAPVELGSVTISAADDGMTLSIAFGPAGLDYLNSFAGGMVLIGGTVPTSPPPDFPQQPFGFTGPDIPGGDPLTPALLVEVVPEPGTMALLGLGAIMVGRKRRRR